MRNNLPTSLQKGSTNLHQQYPVSNGYITSAPTSGCYSEVRKENVDQFGEQIVKSSKENCYTFMKIDIEFITSADDEKHFDTTNFCWLCAEKFLEADAKLRHCCI